MITTKSNFEWKYVEEGERITLEFEGRQPVYFDATRPRVKKWLKSRHRDGAMHEPVFAFVLTKLIEKLDPDVYFDIGAFLGYFTLLPLAALRPAARVYSFEMNKSSCELVRANLEINSHLAPTRVFLVNAGISGKTQFNQDVWVKGFKLKPQGPDGATNARVDILTLDYIYSQMQIAPDLIKMDIEGFEAPGLDGAEVLLREKRPAILFELHSDVMLESHDATRKSVLDKLKNANYTVLAVDGLRVQSVQTDRPLIRSDSSLYDLIASDDNSAFVAVPDEKLDLLADMIAVSL